MFVGLGVKLKVCVVTFSTEVLVEMMTEDEITALRKQN